MKKQEMTDSIEETVGKMLVLIKLSGAKSERLVAQGENNHKETEAALRWVNHLYSGEWWSCHKVYRLQSVDAWAMYDHMDGDDFREVKMLKTALITLRKKINGKTRPEYFKKGKNAKQNREAAV